MSYKLPESATWMQLREFILQYQTEIIRSVLKAKVSPNHSLVLFDRRRNEATYHFQDTRTGGSRRYKRDVRRKACRRGEVLPTSWQVPRLTY